MTRKSYSESDERSYYASARENRQAIPYDHLDAYIEGSVGKDFFQGSTVLDIGAGEGVYSAWIADPMHGKAARVLGIELTEHRIRREYEQQLTNLKFIAGNVLNMEPERGVYDVVFMNLVLHHLRFCLSDILQFVYKSLPTGGRFFAIEPNTYSPSATLAHMLHDKSANEGFLSPRKVRAALMTQGFKKVEIGYFWRNRKWARNPILASSFYVVATK